jgi:hypothetical protein
MWLQVGALDFAGRHVWSIEALSGPAIGRIANQPLPSTERLMLRARDHKEPARCWPQYRPTSSIGLTWCGQVEFGARIRC